MARIKLLSSRGVEALPTGFHADGGNLYLRVKDTGSRAWVFRYKLAGKVREIGLGSTLARDLKEARELAGLMRNAVEKGEDPADVLKAPEEAEAKTFKAYAEELVAAKVIGFRNAKHIQQWSNTLATYAYPVIGDKLAAEITLADVKAILNPIWATKTETAVRLRQRIEAVLDYAAVHEDSDRRNPARWRGTLDKVLQAPRKVTKVQHHAAAPYEAVPGVMAALAAKDSTSAHCLRFAILTAARSGEARGAAWAEIDEKAKAWVIPGERMKAGREHKVPLTDDALAILTAMKPRKAEGSDLIFPGPTGAALSDVAVNKTLKGVLADVTVHGFRSSFRMWGAETTGFPSAILELSLAHVNKNETEAAYQRSDLFEPRKKLMAAWSKYCTKGGKLIHLAADNAA